MDVSPKEHALITPLKNESSSLYVEQEEKRFATWFNPLVPTLVLDAEGTIRHITAPARNLLEYRTTEGKAPYFFSLVHPKNLYQVMRDVADMVCYNKEKASWLFRLRTGDKKWRWCKAEARNSLNSEGAIIVRLYDAADLVY